MIVLKKQYLTLFVRAYDCILKVACTIADLEGKKDVHHHHLSEVIHYRSMDRKSWEERTHIFVGPTSNKIFSAIFHIDEIFH